MSQDTLEQRVERLEQIVAQLRNEVPREPGRDDWQSTVGMFTGDPIAREILDEALHLRDAERANPTS